MDWLDRTNAALDYIEANLAGEIDLRVVAREACCSEYHFTRMFSFITGVPLNEYIRRRRLTLAGLELKQSKARVIDLALKYGYDSPNSFTRAFQTMHGVTPSAARAPGVELKSFARMTFAITVQGDTSLNYRIVEKGPFAVFGVSVEVTQEDGACYRDIPAFIGRCEAERITHKIVAAAGGDERTLLNGFAYALTPEGRFRYMICLDLPAGGVPEEFEIQHVPAHTWAVFPMELRSLAGPESIVDTWKRVFSEWFPTSGYEHADGPEQERLYRKDDGTFVIEAWAPVVRSARP